MLQRERKLLSLRTASIFCKVLPFACIVHAFSWKDMWPLMLTLLMVLPVIMSFTVDVVEDYSLGLSGSKLKSSLLGAEPERYVLWSM